MRRTPLILLFFGCFNLVGANRLRVSEKHENGKIIAKQKERKLSDMMMPGPRVIAMDREGAICSADQMPSQRSYVKINSTVISYYYAVESTTEFKTQSSAGRSIIRLLEDKLFRAIRPAILWCYFDEEPLSRRNLLGNGLSPLQVGIDLEKGATFRKLSLEEARRLSVVSFSNSPEDKEVLSINCNFETSDAHCIVMEGRVTIMHHATSNVDLAIASIYDSTQKAMDNSEMYFDLGSDESLSNITNIVWLGETMNDAVNGGAVVVGVPNEIIAEVNEQEEEKRSLLAYAVAVPILLALASLLFMNRKKIKRRAVTKGEFVWPMFDDVLIGTGDHPDSFHEGMYHYSQYGVRYLSTNCKQCIETKKNGFFTADDLETISERSVETDTDHSSYRKRNLVNPSSNHLGMKHSSIDVHQCNSARCHICAYKPRDVEFVCRIVEEEDFEEPLRSGESEV